MDDEIIVPIPQKLIELFSGKADMRGAYGGRGSGKTFSFARVLAYLGAEKPLRIVCAREIQLTISDSVFFEIKNAIESCDFLKSQYEFGRSYIRSLCGTEFLFKGLRHNIAEIKGLSQIDYVWIDEAEAVSEESWRELIPTIRKDGSEIWATWNPKDPASKVNKIFRGDDNDPLIKVVEVNYRDNPWFPEKLERERLRSFELDDEDVYCHIWEGGYLVVVGRPVFGKEIPLKVIANCWKPLKRMTLALSQDKFIDDEKGELRVWSLPETGKKYVIGADVAEGLAHGDYSSADVLELPEGNQVAQWHGHIPPDKYALVLKTLGLMYNKALIGVEANNHGLTTNVLLRDSNYPNLYVQRAIDDGYSGEREQSRIGWLTTSKSKPYIIDLLDTELRDGTHGIACAETAAELQTYVIHENGSYGAQQGCYDDRVMSLAIAKEMMRQSPHFKR
jgi:hypothetical protein